MVAIPTRDNLHRRLTHPRIGLRVGVCLLVRASVALLVAAPLMPCGDEEVDVQMLSEGTATDATIASSLAPMSRVPVHSSGADEVALRRSSPGSARGARYVVESVPGESVTNHPGDIVIFEAGPWYASNSDGFLADCGRQLDNWAIGRAVIPSRLVISLHKKGVYRLAIDVRAGAPRGPLSGEVTSVDHLPVRCAMVARLTALGDGLRIDGDANWTMRWFSTPGTVEWAWTILANEAGHTQVRLEIRPVILQALPNGEVQSLKGWGLHLAARSRRVCPLFGVAGRSMPEA
jgi:hypothetical protein